jgi:hypothetical protein
MIALNSAIDGLIGSCKYAILIWVVGVGLDGLIQLALVSVIPRTLA